MFCGVGTAAEELATYRLPLTAYRLPLTTYHLPLTAYRLPPYRRFIYRRSIYRRTTYRRFTYFPGRARATIRVMLSVPPPASASFRRSSQTWRDDFMVL